jgi:hypothetical protein
MAFGPGRYDDLCSYVREQAGIEDGAVGGALVVIIGGNRGVGFSLQADAQTTAQLPALLEGVAEQIRRHGMSSQ